MTGAELRRVWPGCFGRPGPKLICVGLNYRDHAEEQGVPLPAAPLLFGNTFCPSSPSCARSTSSATPATCGSCSASTASPL